MGLMENLTKNLIAGSILLKEQMMEEEEPTKELGRNTSALDKVSEWEVPPDFWVIEVDFLLKEVILAKNAVNLVCLWKRGIRSKCQKVILVSQGRKAMKYWPKRNSCRKGDAGTVMPGVWHHGVASEREKWVTLSSSLQKKNFLTNGTRSCCDICVVKKRSDWVWKLQVGKLPLHPRKGTEPVIGKARSGGERFWLKNEQSVLSHKNKKTPWLKQLKRFQLGPGLSMAKRNKLGTRARLVPCSCQLGFFFKTSISKPHFPAALCKLQAARPVPPSAARCPALFCLLAYIPFVTEDGKTWDVAVPDRIFWESGMVWEKERPYTVEILGGKE